MRHKLARLTAKLFDAAPVPGINGARHGSEARAVTIITLSGVVISLFAALLYWPYSALLFWAHIGNLLVYFFSYCSYRRNPDPRFVSRACSLSLFLVVLVVNMNSGGVSSPAIDWFLPPALASALLIGWREGWVWIGIAAVSVVALYLCGTAGVLPPAPLPEAIVPVAAAIYAVMFSLVIGMLLSLWVARQRALQAELRESLARSKADTATARLFADSAAAANGSMDFAGAARRCLQLVCEHQSWCAAHVWLRAADGTLRSTDITYQPAPAGAAEPLDFAPGRACDDRLAAGIARDRAGFVIGRDLHDDQRFGAAVRQPRCVLAWPVAIDGVVEIVLEFFSDSGIDVDDDLRRILDHIDVQMAHVRLREAMHDRTESMAFTDPVSCLPNRLGFEHLFEQKLKDCKRDDSRLALMFVDLDGFKRVNDTLGHAVGDRLLHAIGQRLEQQVRESDLAAKLEQRHGTVAARLGGDEFTLVLAGIDESKAVAGAAQRFLDVLAEPIDVGYQEVNVGASIGIAIYPDDGETLSELMRLADAAMYEAKALPGSQFRFATPALNDAIQRRMWLEAELCNAIRQDELRVCYAPVAAALTGRIIAKELFVSWPHRSGEIAFEEFWSVAETSGLAAELGYWTIEKACAAISRTRFGGESLRMCVDISLLNLQQPAFVDTVAAILARYDTPRGMLEFEFSETSAILTDETCREAIRQLHDKGIRVVLDRFGAGYSSLIDLARLPVWRIKLDREFLEAVTVTDGNRSMGRAIISMAHSQGIETTIYGVDTAAQAAWLKELGCDALQGNWVGHPEDAPERAASRPWPAAPHRGIDADMSA